MLTCWRLLNLFISLTLIHALVTCQNSYSYYTDSEFTHTSSLFYSWEPDSGFSRVIQEYKGTEVNESFKLPEFLPVTQIIKPSWFSSHKNSCVQMCSRRSGNQESALIETPETGKVTINHLRANGFSDCYEICFKETTGETVLGVIGGFIEPQLTNQRTDSDNIRSTFYTSLNLYTKKTVGTNSLAAQNNSDSGTLFSPGTNSPSYLSYSGGGFPSMGDDKPFKPAFLFQGSDIDITLFGYEADISERALMGEVGDVVVEVHQEGTIYRLVLSQKEWQELVARNLHNSVSVLSRLARFQSEGRNNRSLLLDELDRLSDNQSLAEEVRKNRIQSLLMEHDDIPPERIYLHSWLAAIYEQFLQEETGFELLLTEDEKRNPEVWLKKLEEVAQALLKEKKLQQAIDDARQWHSENENNHQDVFSGSLDQLSLVIHQRVDSLWQVLLADSLAGAQEVIKEATINPTPVFLHATTGEGAKNTRTGNIHSTSASSGSSTSQSLTPSNLEKGSGGAEGNGGDERENQAPKQPSDSNGNAWQPVIDKLLTSTVKIEFQQVKDVGRRKAGSYIGTGFIVDTEKGIVLTNKHIGTSHPVLARAKFNNQESIELRPLYSDPVNDFGFYQYSPQDLQYNQPQSLPLKPSAARVGEEVMLAGCNIGERMSIFVSHLADLERQAPGYDFNTFYYLAAISTSGGSSGSPVVNRQGEVVAINSGKLEQSGKTTAGALLLPVVQAEKVLRALQNNINVSRGSIQAALSFSQIDKLTDMGLSEQSRTTLANSGCGGLLVVKNVIPQGVADGELQNGDIVIRLNGDLACSFDLLVDAMNASVGQHLSLEIERNGEIRSVSLPVVDAFSMDLDKIFELAGAHFHDVPYHYAFQHNIPFEGVYISRPGAYFERAALTPGDIIQIVGGVATHSLADFIREIGKVKSGASIGLTYTRPRNYQMPMHTTVTFNKAFFPTALFTRNYGHQHWQEVQYPADESRPDSEVKAACSQSEGIATTVEERWGRSLVRVEITFPFETADRPAAPVTTLGFIVDINQGFVLIDNMAVTTSFADIRLIFPEAQEVAAVVFKQHPKYPMAILKYATSDLDFPVESNELVNEEFYSGQKVKIVGLDDYGSLRITENQICNPFLGFQHMRSTHLMPKEEAELQITMMRRNLGDARFSFDTYCGLIVNENNEVIGVNIFPYGTNPAIFTARQISRFIEQINNGADGINDLGIGVKHISDIQARRHGVSDEWLRKKGKNKKKFMEITEVDLTAPAADVLKAGDVILSINSESVNEYADLAALIEDEQELVKLDIRVLRSGQEHQIETTTTSYPFEEFTRIILWQGMAVHEPLGDFKKICKFEYGCVQTAGVFSGSPAERAGVPTIFVVEEVDGSPTPDMNTFEKAVAKPVDKKIIKVKVRGILSGVIMHLDLRQDYFYWPTCVYSREKSGHWRMSRH